MGNVPRIPRPNNSTTSRPARRFIRPRSRVPHQKGVMASSGAEQLDARRAEEPPIGAVGGEATVASAQLGAHCASAKGRGRRAEAKLQDGRGESL